MIQDMISSALGVLCRYSGLRSPRPAAAAGENREKRDHNKRLPRLLRRCRKRQLMGLKKQLVVTGWRRRCSNESARCCSRSPICAASSWFFVSMRSSVSRRCRCATASGVCSTPIDREPTLCLRASSNVTLQDSTD